MPETLCGENTTPHINYCCGGGIDLANIDWVQLKAEYASTKISYRKMAEKYGISFNTLKDHAGVDKWADARKKFENTVTKNTIQRLASKKANSCVKQLSSVGNAAVMLTATIERITNDADQFRRHLVTERVGEGTGPGEYTETQEVKERIYDKYDTKSLKDLTGALKDLAGVIRNVYGIPTIVEEAAIGIAAKRLQLEEIKAGVNDTDDSDTGVIILPAVMAEPEPPQEAEHE
jgi:hypothetical protein